MGRPREGSLWTVDFDGQPPVSGHPENGQPQFARVMGSDGVGDASAVNQDTRGIGGKAPWVQSIEGCVVKFILTEVIFYGFSKEFPKSSDPLETIMVPMII